MPKQSTSKYEGKWGELFAKPQPKKAELLIDSLDDYLYESKNNKPREGAKASLKNPIGWHPSQLDKDSKCKRKLAYQYTNTHFDWTQGAFSAQTLRIFDNGHSVHARLQDTIAHMGDWSKGQISLVGKWKCGCGHKVGGDSKSQWKPKPDKCPSCGRVGKWEYREVGLSDQEHSIVGRTDGVINWRGEEWLLEIKSMSPFQFPKMTEPPQAYLVQANLYMFMSKIKKMLFIVECKGTQKLKEYHIKYDPTIVKPILRILKSVQQAIQNKKWPMRLKQPEAIKQHCRTCEYSKPCKLNLGFGWNISEKEIAQAGGG